MANRYWVGGAGTWDDTNHWSLTSGGAGGASVPTIDEDVYFDGNSGTGLADGSGLGFLECNSLDCTGYGGQLTIVGISIGNAGAGKAGTIIIDPGMTFTISDDIFIETSNTNCIIDTQNVLLQSVFVSMNTTDTVVSLASALNSDNDFILSGDGLFDTNGFDITTSDDFDLSTGSDNDLTVDLGASTITTGGFFSIEGLSGGLNVINSGSSTIVATIPGGDDCIIGGGWTLGDITVTLNGSSSQLYINGALSGANLTLTSADSGMHKLLLAGALTLSGTLSITGTIQHRILMSPVDPSDNDMAIPTLTTVTANAVSLSYVDFYFIDGAGTAAPFTGTSLGDLGGNTDVTTTTPVTRYWVAEGGNWNDTAHWATSSGGTAGASAPLPQDTVVFDANSITTADQTISISNYHMGAVDFSDVDNTPTFQATNTVYAIGDINMNGLATDGAHSLGVNIGADDRTITFPLNHTTYYNMSLRLAAVATTITMGADGGNTRFDLVDLTVGTLELGTNNVVVQGSFFGVRGNGTNFRLKMGSGVWLMLNNGTQQWNLINSPGTVEAETSELYWSTTGAVTMQGGGNTYYDIKIAEHATNVFTLTGNNTIHNLEFEGVKTIAFGNGSTTTISGDIIALEQATDVVTIKSQTNGQTHTLTKPSGLIDLDYMNIRDSIATGGAAWYAGNNSTDTGNNTGWIFTAAPAFIFPTGIASSEAFGTPSMFRLDQFLQPSSFRGDLGSGGGDVFGTPRVGVQQYIKPQPIQSGEAFGTASLEYPQDVTASGIASVSAFGTPRMIFEVEPTGIASALAFGTAKVRNRRAPINLWRKSSEPTNTWRQSNSN